MKASFLIENVINFLPLINKVLPSHSQVPILSNILIVVGKEGILLKATDLDLGIEIKIPASIEEEGSTTVPGREFVEAINSLPKDKVGITMKEEKLIMKCRNNTISFNTISEKEFPQLYKERGEEVAVFTSEEFRDIFSYLVFAVSQEEARPQLTGVYIDKKEEWLNFVATDGYRMSVKRVVSGKKKIEEGLIVSVGLVNEVMGLKKEEVVMRVNGKENQIVFEVGEVVLVGRMIGGSYPDYERVIPQTSKTTALLDREQLLQNVRLSSVFARDASNVVGLEVKKGELYLQTKTQGVGEGETVMEVKQEGEDNKAAFNIRYLHDLVKTVAESEITMGLNSPNEPALFEIKEKNFKHVIMPIQAED